MTDGVVEVSVGLPTGAARILKGGRGRGRGRGEGRGNETDFGGGGM